MELGKGDVVYGGGKEKGLERVRSYDKRKTLLLKKFWFEGGDVGTSELTA